MKKGFTLLELVIVISILGALIAMASGNFMTSLKRGRDVKRKAELAGLRTALQLYYMDYGQYPAGAGAGGNYRINGCGTNGTSSCPPVGCTTVDFGAGSANCTTTVYMTRLPAGYGDVTFHPMRYFSTASQSNFCILQALELTTDDDIAASQARCVTQCSGVTVASNYVACNE